MNKLHNLSVTALALFMTVQTQAETTLLSKMDALVITATGQAAAVQDVQASVEVIDREQLDQYGDANVTQALKHAVGVSASNGGATGDISIRGFNRNHTLVLVDGLRRTNNYGGNNPNQISYFDIERIEIIRGPLSSLYGSEALGGVVNVITRHPGSNPGVSVSLNAGTADRDRGSESLRTGVNLRTGNETLGHSITLEQNYRNHFRHTDSQSDDAGRLNNWSGSYRGRWSVNQQSHLGWALEVFDRDSQAHALDRLGDSYTRFEEEKRYFGSLDFRHQTDQGEWIVRGSIGNSEGSTNRSHPNIETTDFRQYQADAIHHAFVGNNHLVSLGLGALQDQLDVSINSREATQNNQFFLLQDQWEITPNWQLVAGFRYDDFNNFGDTINPRISLGWTEGLWSARLGYGTGFRAPSLLEQHSSFVRGRLLIRGNSELQAEESSTWEAMLRRRIGDGYIEATLHHNRVEQLINSFTTPEMVGPLQVVEYRNIDRANLQGAELVGYWPITPKWSVLSSIEWLDAKDGSTQQRLTGRPKSVIKAEVQYTPSQTLNLSMRARHMADYLSTDASAPRGSAPRNSSLTVADLSLRYQVYNGIQFTGGIDNLFDQRDPENFTLTATGTQRNSPDARYFHLGARFEF